MAKYDATHPALSLHGQIGQSWNAVGQYDEEDETGLFEENIRFEFTIEKISAQQHFDDSTRVPKKYDGIDIKSGDWITNKDGTVCLQIKSISFKSVTEISLIAEDINGINIRQYSFNTFSSGETVIIFELSENGLPVIAGDAAGEFNLNGMDRVQSRFSIDEDDERFRLDHDVAPTINIGEVAAIDDYGNLVKHGTLNSSTTPIGTIISKTRNGKSVYIKPFNKIIDTYPDPSILTGSPGETYYTDSSNPGGLTTTKTPGAKPLYIHLRDSVPSEIISTSSTALPGGSDRIIINNFTVFDGTIGHSVNSSIDLKNMINAQSSVTKVTATADIDDIFSESQLIDLHPQIGEVHQLISGDSGQTYVYPRFEISDGTTNIEVELNPFNYGLTSTGFQNSTQYLIITADDMASILNSEFVSNNVNLEASTFSHSNKTYPLLRIDGLNGASITITNLSADAFGTSFAGTGSGSGLELNTAIGTNAFLKLLRADGGDILITGGLVGAGGGVSPSGGYINNNGICSSSSGRPAIIMMIEGSSEGGGSSEAGVSVIEDHDMTPQATSGNGSPTGCFITYTPFLDSMVEIKVNGIAVDLGSANNYQTKTCYFSPDGFIVRDIQDIEAGDQLYWNTTEGGYDLDSSDDIDFVYQTSSSNIS